MLFTHAHPREKSVWILNKKTQNLLVLLSLFFKSPTKVLFTVPSNLRGNAGVHTLYSKPKLVEFALTSFSEKLIHLKSH